MNWKNGLVAIFCPTTESSTSGIYGTGFPLPKRDVIMTARHNVRPSDVDVSQPILAKWWHGKHSWCELGHDLIFWESEQFDLALLKFSRPSDIRDFCLPRLIRPPDGETWSSAGFPTAARIEDDIKPANFLGDTMSNADEPDFFEVIVRDGAAPETVEGWGGASGMPVMVAGTVIGVAIEVWKGFDCKKIKVSPLWKLADDEDFRERAGFSTETTAYEKECERLFQSFLANSDAKQLAFKDVVEFSKLFGDKDLKAGTAVQSMKRRTPADNFRDFFKVKRSLARQRKERLASGDPGPCPYMRGIQLIDELIGHLAPLIFVTSRERSSLLALSSLQEIPVSTATMAELMAAALDTRPAAFFPRSSKKEFEPRGIAQMPLGLYHDGKKTLVERLGKELQEKEPLPLDHGILSSEIETLLSLDFGERSPLDFDIVNQHLEELADLQEPRPFLALEMPTEEDQRIVVLNDLREIAQKLPALPIFVLTSRSGKEEDKKIRAAEVAELKFFASVIPIVEDPNETQ